MKIGITGHQRLAHEDAWLWVERIIRQLIAKTEPPLVGISSLAIGADQLFAKLVLESGGEVHAIIPYSGIERSFESESALACFRSLVEHCSVETLQSHPSDEDAYLAAGHQVVDSSDHMFAVWDRLPAKGKGGTADVVHYARIKGTAVTIIDPVRRELEVMIAQSDVAKESSR